ncbi:MAG: response regulator [Chitinispirillia bacterium]|nr:response regulator [Chitinispirillia bacterium]
MAIKANRRRIIYVDDINYSLVSLKSRLQSHYEIYPASSVDNMFDIIMDIRPDLILLDINMSHVDGYEAIIRLKTDDRYAKIPVIFLTGKTDRESVRKGYNLGAADYVFKPFCNADLVERIECVFDPSRRKEKSGAEIERKKIIYVDDINVNLASVQVRLRDHYQIFPAQSVNILFEILKQFTPDLILLDVNMPNINGWQAIKLLKSDSRYSAIPVIFLTGQNDKDSIMKGFNLGAADYVTKPFSDMTIRDRINHHLKSKNSGYSSDTSDKAADERLSILAVDEVFNMMSAIGYALGDDYNGSLRGMLQKKFVLLYSLRDLYNVSTLSKLEEIRGFLKENKPDLFILDYKMMAADGFNIIHVIRDFPEHEKTPILFCAPEGILKYPRDAIFLGANDYVEKPIDSRVLREMVAKYIKSKH